MSKYALNLDADGRILSATYEAYATAGMLVVSTLPDGDITDYKYIDGSYVYDPLPKPEPELQEPTTDELLDILLGTGGKGNE
ncbi:MAG: hypothetical protein PUF69_05155 [Eubacteriales bacterium]|nr:hypothetical protein [Eubacteriales bacterium]